MSKLKAKKQPSEIIPQQNEPERGEMFFLEMYKTKSRGLGPLSRQKHTDAIRNIIPSSVLCQMQILFPMFLPHEVAVKEKNRVTEERKRKQEKNFLNVHLLYKRHENMKAHIRDRDKEGVGVKMVA